MAPPSISHKRAALALVAVVVTALTAHDIVPHDGVHEALAQAGFSFAFDGSPTAPQPWRPTSWDVQRNNADGYRQINDGGTGEALSLMQASHGPNCEAPPAVHPINTLDPTVFLCNDHVMTSMNAGYGAIYLTPNSMADFSNGEAVVRFDMSTHTTVGREWVDLWITPYEENLALPLDSWLPPYQGPPKRTVHLKMDGNSDASATGAYFVTEVMRGFQATGLPGQGKGMRSFLTPSAIRRDTFELRISRTHVKFGMPAYNNYWVDADINPPLDWGTGVVQFGHHAYNPTKGCDDTHGGDDPNGTCANTWHWDNVSIGPSRPFAIMPASPRLTSRNTDGRLTFPAPTQANAMLRFAAAGDAIEISTTNGASWFPAQKPPQNRNATEHYKSYMTPIPPGLTSVLVRGKASWAGGWLIQDAAVWSTEATSPPPPTATPTRTPTMTTVPPTSTSTPMPTATSTAVPATSTATPTPMPACTAHYFLGDLDTGLRRPAQPSDCQGGP